MATRTPEQQAALDAALATSLALAEEARVRRRQAIEDFEGERFTRQQVADALRVPATTFANWQERRKLDLEAENGRIGQAWRLYSSRDVLRLGIAVNLSRAGVPADHLAGIIKAIEAVFPLSPVNERLAANLPTWFAILPDGSALGPIFGPALDAEEIAAAAFTALRLDLVIRSSLERLGFTMTHGTAADHRAAIERLAPDAREDAA